MLILLLAPAMSSVAPGEVDFAKLRAHVVGSAVFKEKVSEMCKNAGEMDHVRSDSAPNSFASCSGGSFLNWP